MSAMVKAIVRVAVVTLSNDVLRLVTEQKVNEGDATDSGTKEKILFDLQEGQR